MPDNDRTVFDNGKTEYGGESTVYESRPSGTGEDGFVPGRLLLGTYRIESDPIHGGMGSVWRVHHTGWNTDLAMKRPQPQMFADEASKQNFINECQSWINLGLHPNIVSCYYVREIDGVPAIFSEWMGNGSLENRIQDGSLYEGTEEERQARLMDIAIQYARGLHYAHEQGLIHQDVKPDNLLLTHDWQAKAADFGLSAARAVLTNQDQPKDKGATHMAASGGYTPAYCSMEQMDGKVLTRRTDIYSWAVSVMEMYLGGRPWQNGVVAGMSCRSYFDECRVKMPEKLRDLLERCLHMEPDLRPHDFAAVEEELAGIYRDTLKTDYPRPPFVSSANSVESLNNRALSYLDMGMPEQAEKAWKQALRTGQNHLETVYNQGLYAWRQGRSTVEQAKDRVSNAQGPEDAKERMLRSIDTEAESLKPRLIRSGHDKLSYYEEFSSPGAISPDGKRIYVFLKGDDRTGGLYCFSSEAVNWRYPLHFRTPIDTSVHNPIFLKITPDGKYLLYVLSHGASQKEGSRLRIVETEHGQEAGSLSCDPETICFHPDSRSFYAVQGKTIRKYDLQTVLNGKLFPEKTQYDLSGAGTIYNETFRLFAVPENDRLYGVKKERFYSGRSYGRAGLILEWQESTGRLLRTTKSDYVDDICASPDGKTLYTCGLTGIAAWNTADMNLTVIRAENPVLCLCLSQDGNRMATMDVKGILQLWDMASRRCLRSVWSGHEVVRSDARPPWNSQETLHSLSASSDLSMILSCSIGEKVYAWTIGGQESNAPWEMSRARNYAQQISREKEADALDEQIHEALERYEIDQALSLLDQAENRFGLLRFLPLRRRLMAFCRRSGMADTVEWKDTMLTDRTDLPVSPYADPTGNAVLVTEPVRQRIWVCGEDGQKISERSVLGIGAVSDLCISRSGRYIAAAGGKAVAVMDTVSKKDPMFIRGFSGTDDRTPGIRADISPNEKLLLAGSGHDLGVWSLVSGNRIHTLETVPGNEWTHHPDEADRFRIADVCFSFLGDMAVAVGTDGRLNYYNVHTGKLMESCSIYRNKDRTETRYPVYQLCQSPEDNRLYIRCEHRILIWHSRYGSQIDEIHILSRQCSDFCLSPDGTMYATAEPEGVRLWSLPDRKLLRAFPTLKPEPGQRCLAFSPDSCLLYAATGGRLHAIALKRQLTFPGWTDKWDSGADWRRFCFRQNFPEPNEEQNSLFRQELLNAGFGYIVPGGKSPAGPAPKEPVSLSKKPSRRELNRLKR